MKSRKQLVFLFARKRGISAGDVQRVLGFLMAPPTLTQLSECRVNTERTGWDGSQILATRRDPMDFRDIGERTERLAKDAIQSLSDGEVPFFFFEGGGYLSWECSPEDVLDFQGNGERIG